MDPELINPEDPDGRSHAGEPGEDWGAPEDLDAVVRHVQSTPPGMDPWGLEDEVGLPRAAGRGVRRG